jgi:quinol monooxygenase YgiN
MYLVIAQLQSRPERRNDLVELLTGFAAVTRTEAGCQSYRFTADIEDENAFSSIEVWDDRAALEKHLASPDLAAAVGQLTEILAAPLGIVGYDVAGDPVTFA